MNTPPVTHTAKNRAVLASLLLIWGGVPIAVAAAWAAGANLVAVSIVAVTVAVLGTLGARLDEAPRNITLVFAMVAEVIVANAALAGHPWQIDAHMAYFAVLAAGMMLADSRAVLAGAALVAVHHLVLTLVFPALVYPSADLMENLARTALHGAIVVAETAALVYGILLRNALTRQALSQAADLARSSAEATEARERAEAALAEAERSRSLAEAAQAEAEAALERAAHEAEQARAADERAKAIAEREEAERRALLTKQNLVVETLRASLRKLRGANLRADILTALAPEYEDLREDFNIALSSMRNVIETAQKTAGLIGSETEALVSASADMSRRTETQAQQLAEVTSTVSQLNSVVRVTAENARSAKAQADLTREEVENSAALVAKAVEAMGAIEASSTRIQKIVGVIDDISFQTNLLALNAGVEAARAGESGRGFAVVASEVRALAQRSSEAAQEIKALISESDDRVGEGVGLVRRTGEANEAVMSAVHDIVRRVIEISSGAEEQATSLGEIAQALNALDGVTQRNAAMFEETTAAGQTLARGTRDLVAAISQFHIDDAEVSEAAAWEAAADEARTTRDTHLRTG